MAAIQEVIIRLGDKSHRCRALLDYQYFHLAFMSKDKFEELFGKAWETGAKVEALLGLEQRAHLSEYAILDIEIKGKTLKNMYVWLIDKNLKSVLPPEYLEMIASHIDIILGSTILENYGIRLVKDKDTGAMRIEL